MIVSLILGAVLGIEGLKTRVDRSSLPSQKVATSRMGVRNVGQSGSSSSIDDSEAYSPLKQGEEAHWEVINGCGYGVIYFIFIR